jgi:hypothetical protein
MLALTCQDSRFCSTRAVALLATSSRDSPPVHACARARSASSAYKRLLVRYRLFETAQ